jgi:hypothetical protein
VTLAQTYNELLQAYQQYQPLGKLFPGTQDSEIVKNIQELVQEHNQLLQNYKAIQGANEELQSLRRDIQNTIAHLPGVKTLDEARGAIKGLRQSEARSDAIVGELEATLINWENVGLALLKSEDGRPPTPFQAEKQADHLVQALGIARTKLQEFRDKATNPGMTSTNSGMVEVPFTEAQCRFIWNQIPEPFRRLPIGTPAPLTSEALVEALNQAIGCTHPEEIEEDLATGNLTTTSWEDSRGLIRGLASHECNTTAATTTHETKIFKITDVPEFKNTSEYAGFRSALGRFLRNTDPPPRNKYGVALERILSSFKDPVALAASEDWDITPLLRPTWEATYEAFLLALDDKFESKTILQDVQIEWMKTRPRNDEKAGDFFNRFNAACNKYRSVAERKGAPIPTESVLVSRLNQVLPRYLVDSVRLDLRRRNPPILIDNCTLQELRSYYEDSWAYLPRPAATGHNTKTNYQTATTRAGPAQQGRPNNGNYDNVTPTVKTCKCGYHGSYETAPAVPHQARGSLFPNPRNPSEDAANLARQQYCAQHQLCIYCRRPQAQHQTAGMNFKPVRLASARRAQGITAPPAPEINDQDQLLIEAPPATS